MANKMNSTSSASFVDLLDKEDRDGIETVYKKSGENTEFEIMFYNYKKAKEKGNMLGMENFLNVLQYMKNKSNKTNKYKLEKTVTLDASYSKKPTEADTESEESTTFKSYRLTIDGVDNVNNYLKNINSRSNHVIYKVLLSKFLENDKDVILTKKQRNKEDVYDVDEFNLRARISKEVGASKVEIEELKELTEVSRNDIIFRYKQRVSMIIADTNEYTIRLDLTYVKSNQNINKLEESQQSYELEIEYFQKKKGAPNPKHLSSIYETVSDVLKVIQQSNTVLTKKEKDRIVNQYYNLLGIDRKIYKNLYGRKPISLEIQHVVDILPNKYAVTDKADGNRVFLFIFENRIYFLSYNLDVTDSGIVLPKSLSSYNYTILDGELIYLSNHNKHLFLAFDCLYKKNVDIRQTVSFMERLGHANDVISQCFVGKNDKNFELKDYNKKFNITDFMKHHRGQIDKYLDALNHDILNNPGKPLIRAKYFISVTGGKINEIFKYSKLLWNKYVFDSTTKCPYILDGLVYHPLEQAYIVSARETNFFEYKWKPPDKNTIDFYIKFERNKETNDVMSVYDNSLSDELKWKAYNICYLYVGKNIKDKEIPVLFRRTEGKHVSYLFTDEGEVKDVEGNSIQDGTVVEFYYKHDPDTPAEFRWVPVRTRFDKTESVMLHQKKYGNYDSIADRIWRSIVNPFVMKDIEILSDDNSYDKHISHLRNKIDHSLIVSERKENAYYQVKTTLAKSLRNFHNWIKSSLIYTFYNQVYEYGNKLSVLDYGVGRGGDLMKFYYAKIDYLVGFDSDSNTILSATDGPLSRYTRMRKTHDSFPRMYFVHADGAALLKPEEQKKALGYMSEKNMNMINKFFGNGRKQFDRINCQFVVHYFLGNETIWNNFCTNINMYLKPGGYILLTTYDAQRVVEALGDNDKFSSHYTTPKGEKKLFFEIVKRYDTLPKPIGIGHAIDVHNSMYSYEGVYNTEYLVDKNFLEEELKTKCNLELVDTDLFWNQFEIHRDFFTNIVKFESTKDTREGIFKNAASYYDTSDSVNVAGYEQTKLNRYYVFRKVDNVKQKGGGMSTEESKHNISKTKQGNKKESYTIFNIDGLDSIYAVKNIDDNNLKSSFCGSIHNILRSDGIIPKTSKLEDFYADINANIYKDSDLTKRKINSINKRLYIEHTQNDKVDVVLDGANIIVLEPDCNGDVSTTIYKSKSKKSSKCMLLLHNDNKYQPVYKLDNDNLTGLLKMNDDDVQHMLQL